jgi:predicted small lipoprotein YifL
MSWKRCLNKETSGLARRAGSAGGRLLVLLVFLAGGWGCGIKGPPAPPQQRPAPPVVDLQHRLDGPVFSLSWRLADSGREHFAPAEACRVYRAKTSLNESGCPACPPVFEPVAVVPVDGAASSRSAMRYTETLDAGFAYTYKVTCSAKNGISGDASQRVSVSY